MSFWRRFLLTFGIDKQTYSSATVISKQSFASMYKSVKDPEDLIDRFFPRDTNFTGLCAVCGAGPAQRVVMMDHAIIMACSSSCVQEIHALPQSYITSVPNLMSITKYNFDFFKALPMLIVTLMAFLMAAWVYFTPAANTIVG